MAKFTAFFRVREKDNAGQGLRGAALGRGVKVD
jgi:hypothetical protein